MILDFLLFVSLFTFVGILDCTAIVEVWRK